MTIDNSSIPEAKLVPTIEAPKKVTATSAQNFEALRHGPDPFVAMEMFFGEKLQIEQAILTLGRSDGVRTEKAIYAIACAIAATEYPGDRKQERVSINFTKLVSASTPVVNTATFLVPLEHSTKHGLAARRNLETALVTISAALAASTALQAVDEPLPPVGNLHPIRYAQKVNRHAAEYFRGRVPGLPM